MDLSRVEIPFGDQNLIIETGKFAKLASGAVTLTYGGTVVLVTSCMSKTTREGIDWFPLMVEFQEKTYAAGRIPGGFFKREGRPSESEILAARMIDRPIRPLFPKGMRNDVQVVATVLSSDGENDPDVLGIIGASASLMISDIPFNGPVGAVRVGLIDGQFVANPTYVQREQSDLDIIVVGYSDHVIMIEGEAKEVEEQKMMEAIAFGFEKLKPVSDIQKEMVKEVGKMKMGVKIKKQNPEFVKKIKELTLSRLTEIYKMSQKEDRQEALEVLLQDLSKDLSQFDAYKKDDQEIREADIKEALEEAEAQEVRRIVLEERRRVDMRGFEDIRPLSCEVKVLPRTHGSGLFTRGQTQSLSVTTLGTRTDERLIEALEGKSYKTFMLHYNFPSFSVGETRPMRGPGRREIGHGALAEKAIKAVMPTKEEFPYTVRVVSEILESNGSSSMATVCAASLSLMDAGVPVSEAVAGISVGLVTGENESVLLTDIMGVEDHLGDMDFKVAGTRRGITAIQLDLKIEGIDLNLLTQATERAKQARFKILDKMHRVIDKPRDQISDYAPRLITLKINREKIGSLIGPGGKNIRKLIDETGCSIDIEDDGTVVIASTVSEDANRAAEQIRLMMEEPEVGKVYNAKVTRIMNFGAFCEFLPGKEGLVHISELSNEYVKDINKYVKIGDEFKVKLIEIDDQNRCNLSKKKAE